LSLWGPFSATCYAIDFAMAARKPLSGPGKPMPLASTMSEGEMPSRVILIHDLLSPEEMAGRVEFL
jgi:hypothetical protein